MRVLMLIDSYLPVLGGAQEYVHDLSLELVRRGHDVAICTLWNEGLAEFEVVRGVRIYRIHSTAERVRGLLFQDSARQFAPPFADPMIALGLYRVVQQEKPDIVHAHNWLVYSFLPLKAWAKVPVVMSLHEYSLSCAKWVLMRRSAPCSGPGLAKCLGCATDHYGAAKGTVTVLGKRAMEPAERWGVDIFLPVSHATAVGNKLAERGLPFEVMPNFVLDDVAECRGDGTPWTSQLPDDDYLLYVGALSRYKGIEVLLRAYEGLVNPPPLVLIGFPRPDTPVTFPPNVTVLTDWPHDAVIQAWRRSLAGLMPSIWAEPFGIVVLEAMASGRPVIASRMGGLTDMVVDGETGFLVPPDDSAALRQAIERLLADAPLRERMGQAALARVSQFRASAIVPRVEAVYRDLLQKGLARTKVAGWSSRRRGDVRAANG